MVAAGAQRTSCQRTNKEQKFMPRRSEWSVRDAKNRFREVVEAAQRRPQTVTKRGKRAVVIISVGEYDRLRKLDRLKTPSFAEMLLTMPQGDVEFERLNAKLRDFEF
jgi:antitoxin Phd